MAAECCLSEYFLIGGNPLFSNISNGFSSLLGKSGPPKPFSYFILSFHPLFLGSNFSIT